MRIRTFVLAILLALAPVFLHADPWVSSGRITATAGSPLAANAVILDGGVIENTSDITVKFRLMIAGSQAAVWAIQKVDVDGTTVLKEQGLMLQAGQTQTFDFSILLSNGQKWRLVNLVQLTSGVFEASIFNQ